MPEHTPLRDRMVSAVEILVRVYRMDEQLSAVLVRDLYERGRIIGPVGARWIARMVWEHSARLGWGYCTDNRRQAKGTTQGGLKAWGVNRSSPV